MDCRKNRSEPAHLIDRLWGETLSSLRLSNDIRLDEPPGEHSPMGFHSGPSMINHIVVDDKWTASAVTYFKVHKEPCHFTSFLTQVEAANFPAIKNMT